jgi:NAD(P)-dependent dehydrogenase (short-subunit alcohol dehydrogenase family)
VDGALERFGRIDIVVNNAGIMRWAGMPEVDADMLAQHLAVHVGGSFNTTRAAWPYLVEQGYGRIVMTTSTGMLGLPTNLPYATAKAGLIGMTRSLTVAGRKHGIKVNLIAPAAFTRMAGQADDGGAAEARMPPDFVAPMVAYLAHEACPVSGEIYSAGAGRFARLFLASTDGYVHRGGAPSVEDVADHWDSINDETGYFVPTDLMDWSAAFTAHLES